VTVSVTVDAPPAQVYAALTDPLQAVKWFGALSEPLRTGGQAQLDFGDGDFFTIDEIVATPPESVEYRWQFLGIMPTDSISWRFVPEHNGTSIVIVDRGPLRDPAWLDELCEGWRDFTRRLVTYLATGRWSRYDWRRVFDGGIELPLRAEDAMTLVNDPNASAAWFPAAGGLRSGASLELDDGGQPRVFQIEALSREDLAVRFAVTSATWTNPTECVIGVKRRGERALLTVEHQGWETINDCEEIQRAQRRRFAGLWIRAMQRARDVCVSDGVLPADLRK
jgi:uncharacterized protein YndB with AHSA1/START domain